MITDSLTPRTTLLALDLGTTTGWALRAAEGQIARKRPVKAVLTRS